jgi:hypothetical protein
VPFRAPLKSNYFKLIYVCFDNPDDNPGVFSFGGQTKLKTPFTTISMNKMEPDLGLFLFAGDEVIILARK